MNRALRSEVSNWIAVLFVSHSDGTHSLQFIHLWARDVMLNFSKFAPMKKATHLAYILHGPRVIFQQMFIFWSI